MSETYLDAVEAGVDVDLTEVENTLPAPPRTLAAIADQGPTLQGPIVSPEAIRPRTSRETVAQAPLRQPTAATDARRDNILPPVPTTSQAASQETRDAVDAFNVEWPYPTKARIFANRAQYETALQNNPGLDVIPIFNDRVRNNNPRQNIMYGLMERFTVPELLGEQGEHEFVASLREFATARSTPLGRAAREVRRQYGDTLTEDEVVSEAFARTLEGGFQQGEVQQAVDFIRNTIAAHGATDLANNIGDGVFRSILMNTGSLYRAPNRVDGNGNTVPDPGGITHTPSPLQGRTRFNQQGQELQRSPGVAWLAERRRDVSARRAFGSVYRLRTVRNFIQQQTGTDAFGPLYNAFVRSNNRAAQLAERDRAQVIDNYDRLATQSRRRLGFSKEEFSDRLDRVLKSLHTLERNQWFQLQQGQYNRGATLQNGIEEIDVAAGVTAENARIVAMNLAQEGTLNGTDLRGVLEQLWDEHGSPSRDSQFYFDNAAAQETVDAAASELRGGTNVLAELQDLYARGIRPINERTNQHRQNAGVNGVGFNNIIEAMAFEFYVPLTDARDTSATVPMFARDRFNASNRRRYTAQQRGTNEALSEDNNSQHLLAAVIEQLDLAHHEVADTELMQVLATFAEQEFAIDRGNGVLNATTGADILGITFGAPSAPAVFGRGAFTDNNGVSRSGWRAPPVGSQRNQFTIRENGQTRVMTIADSGTAEALAARWPSARTGILAEAEVVTRSLAASFTTRKPTFWPKQFLRDVQSTPVLIGTEVSAEAGARTLTNIGNLLTPGRLRQQYQYFMSDPAGRAQLRQQFASDPLMSHFNDFVEAGGLSLFTEQLQLVGRNEAADQVAGRGPALARGIRRLTGTAAVEAVFSRMDAVTNTMENMHRLAAFAAMREAGLSIPEATTRAIEIINFGQNSLQVEQGDNTQGLGATVFGANGNAVGQGARHFARSMFAFSRSGATGTDRFWNRALWRNGEVPLQFRQSANGQFTRGLATPTDVLRNLNYPMIGFMIGQGVAVSALVGSMASNLADDDEDGTLGRNIPLSQWMGNIIIPLEPGNPDNEQHISLPLQIGAYKFFYGLGAAAVQVSEGNADYDEALFAVVNSFAENTTPSPRYSQDENVSTAILKTLSPTVIRPILSLGLNSSDFGGPIYADTRGSAFDTSAYQRAFQSTPDVYTDMSRSLQSLSGGSGNPVINRLTDVSPESIRYMFRSYTGDVGNVMDRLLRDLDRQQSGLDRSAITDGVFGGFVPNTNSSRWVPQNEYWTARNDAEGYIVNLNNRERNDTGEGTRTAQQYERTYPNVRQLRTLVSRSDTARQRLNRERRRVESTQGLTTADRQERLRQINSRYRRQYLRDARAIREIIADY